MNARQSPAPTVDVSGAALRKLCLHNVAAVVLAGAIGSLGLANPAYADGGIHTRTLYSTSFEQPKFLGGEQLLGLDGWTTAIPDFLNPMAAKITGAAARRGEQSIEVRGAALNSANQVTPFYDAVGSYRRQLDYTVSGDRQIVRIEADLLLDTNQAPTAGDFFTLNIAARSGDGKTLGELGLSSDGKVNTYPFNAAPGEPTPLYSTDTTFNRWHRVAILLDYLNSKTSYFMDGHQLGETTSFAESKGNVLARASMVVYARKDGGETGTDGSLRSNYTARFDNFKVSVGRDPQEKMSSADDEKD